MEKKEISAEDRSFEDLNLGDEVSFDQTWTDKDVSAFAELSGDRNPLHMDESYAKNTKFKQCIVHGMLAASSFSKLLGMHLPGKRCLYLKQSIVFKKPIFMGERLRVSGKVIAKVEAAQMLDIELKIYKKEESNEEIAIEGEARVQII